MFEMPLCDTVDDFIPFSLPDGYSRLLALLSSQLDYMKVFSFLLHLDSVIGSIDSFN